MPCRPLENAAGQPGRSDQPLAVSRYQGDGVTITYTNGVPNAPSASSLRAYSTTEYDDQGRVYQSNTYDVNPSTGPKQGNWLPTTITAT